MCFSYPMATFVNIHYLDNVKCANKLSALNLIKGLTGTPLSKHVQTVPEREIYIG